MKPQNRYAPLDIWGIVFVFVIIVATASFYFADRSFIRDNVTRLRTFNNKNEKRIIAIGTSLLGQATYYNHSMSDFAIENGFDEFSYLRLTKNGGILEDFIPLMPEIIRAKPDIVIIESDLITLAINKSEKLNIMIRRHKNFLRHFVGLFLNFFTNSKPITTELAGEIPKKPAVMDNKAYKNAVEFKKKFKVRDIGQLEEIEDFFLLAKERKINVLIAEVPRYAKIEEEYDESLVNKEKKLDLIQDLKTKYDIEYLKFPEELGLEYYVDFAHFNQAGRERYSLWLLSYLSKF